MTRFRHDQRGWTLIEMLLAMTLMLIVLGATLNSFDGFVTRQAKATRLQDQQENARVAMDRMIQQLRNLANPVVASQNTIDTAEDYKIIFQTTDPQKQWVMYCVDTTTRTLWYQISAALAGNPAVNTEMRTACPSLKQATSVAAPNYWATTLRITPSVNNGASRPAFSYTTVDASSGAASLLATPVSTVNKPKVNAVSADLWIDTNPADKPPETEIRSGVYLRNQNQAPTARFGVTQGTGQKYTFTASASSDPEQRTLQYNWYRTSGSSPTAFPSTAPKANCPSGATCLPDCPSKVATTVGGVTWTCMGSDAVVTRDFGVDVSANNLENVWLRVTDPGFLGDFSDLPTGGCQLPTARVALTDCAQVRSGSGL